MKATIDAGLWCVMFGLALHANCMETKYPIQYLNNIIYRAYVVINL